MPCCESPAATSVLPGAIEAPQLVKFAWTAAVAPAALMGAPVEEHAVKPAATKDARQTRGKAVFINPELRPGEVPFNTIVGCFLHEMSLYSHKPIARGCLNPFAEKGVWVLFLRLGVFFGGAGPRRLQAGSLACPFSRQDSGGRFLPCSSRRRLAQGTGSAVLGRGARVSPAGLSGVCQNQVR